MSNVVRKIIHVDMDAYFASVEQLDDPSLWGRPVAVGSAQGRGVVAAASYEARKFGVHSAMPSVTAARKCPDLVFVPPRFERYRELSQHIRSIFRDYTPLVEPMSLDEAYLDVTENLRGIPLAIDVAKQIRARIRQETGLTASAGVSMCKFLAKMASDQRKPDGLFVIPPEHAIPFIHSLPIKKFHGIGPKTAERMHGFGIITGADLAERSEEFLKANFGKSGGFYYKLARGIDERKVEPNQPRKSVGIEDTFVTDIRDPVPLREEISRLAGGLWPRCERTGARGRTLTMKVKYEDFSEISRSRTLLTPFTDQEQIETVALTLLEGILPLSKGVRLLGLTVSGLKQPGEDVPDPQLSLGF